MPVSKEKRKMNRLKKVIITILPLLIIALISVVSFLFFGGTEQAEPKNPLLENAENSHMLLSFGGELDFFEEVTEESQNGESDEAPKEKTTQEQTEKESKTQNQAPTPAKSDNKNQSETRYEPSTVSATESRVKPSRHNSSKADSGNGLSDENADEKATSEVVGENETEVFFETTTQPKTTIASDGETEEEIPGEVLKPNDEQTDKVYFTTSISDGETVKKSDYYFEIYHNYSELTIESVRVYVNGTQVNQFKGNVLLTQGQNVIRVAVEYKDESGRIISAYRDYKVTARLGKIEIQTNLASGTVSEARLDFTASAVLDGKKIPVKVTLNGEILDGENEKYSAELMSGENTVIIYAESEKMFESKQFNINCTAQKTLDIYTDLTDKTVNDESLDFIAYILNGTERARLSATLNGNPIKCDSEGVFTAKLKIGDNRIRLKATDKVGGENVTVDKSFTIKMVPLSQEGTAPYLRYVNVTDGMTVKGNDFKLDLDPVDYEGNRIYSNGITVKLNDNIYEYEWQSEYTSYKLWFVGGENKLEVRITDKDGRYTDYSYTINCEVFEEGAQTGTITVSVDANVLGLGYIVSPTEIPIYQGENGADTITRFLEEKGFTYEYDGTIDVGFYLSRIGKSGIGKGVSIPEKLTEYINADGIEWKEQRDDNSLGEFDYTQGSGWMYSINQSFPNHGLSDAMFKDGDVVRIRFTLTYGKDINGYSAAGGQFTDTGGQNGNYEKTW